MPESYKAQQALKRAKSALFHYIEEAGNTNRLNLSTDCQAEINEIVDDIFEAAVAEIKHYINNK